MVLVAVACWAVGLAWLAWVVADQSSPVVQSQLKAYEVVDGQRAEAQITVKLARPDVVATCLARATAADSSVVGEQSFTVRGDTRPRRFTVLIRTERRATSVVSVGCTAPDQSRPR